MNITFKRSIVNGKLRVTAELTVSHYVEVDPHLAESATEMARKLVKEKTAEYVEDCTVAYKLLKRIHEVGMHPQLAEDINSKFKE